jgi:hypothetical protein
MGHAWIEVGVDRGWLIHRHRAISRHLGFWLTAARNGLLRRISRVVLQVRLEILPHGRAAFLLSEYDVVDELLEPVVIP